jgi:cell division septation protein DedD
VAETPKPLVTTVATPASPPLPAKKTTKTALNKAASGTPQPLITAAATPSHLSADKTTETAAEMSPAKKSEAPEAMTKAVAKTAAMAEARPTPGATAIGIDHNEKSPVSAHVQLGSYSTIPIAAANWQALVGHYPMLRRLHPVIVQVDLGSQGIFERLQTGPFPNRTTAAAFCAKLKADNRTCDVLPAKHATVSNIAPSDNTSAETAGLLTTDP